MLTLLCPLLGASYQEVDCMLTHPSCSCEYPLCTLLKTFLFVFVFNINVQALQGCPVRDPQVRAHFAWRSLLSCPCSIWLWDRWVSPYLSTCWVFVEYLLSICWVLVDYLLSTCWVLVDYLLSTCWVFVEYLLSICWVYVNYSPIRVQYDCEIGEFPRTWVYLNFPCQ